MQVRPLRVLSAEAVPLAAALLGSLDHLIEGDALHIDSVAPIGYTTHRTTAKKSGRHLEACPTKKRGGSFFVRI